MSTVAPTAEEFLGDVTNIRRARLAAIVLNHMVDYWFLENQTTFKNKSDVYTELERRCPQFPIIRDVADASKHAELDRRPRKLTSSDQVRMTPGLFEAPFGEGGFAEAMEVIVVLDDQTSCLFAIIVQAALSLWKALLW
ncbi:hypothetical protein [Rhodoblastus sp.]